MCIRDSSYPDLDLEIDPKLGWALRHPELFPIDINQEYKIPAHMLQIEITESMLSRDYHMIIAFIQRMRKQGIEFLLDDFGTGYSNISNVLSLPIQTIKIDKSLLWKAMVSTEGAVVLRKMLSLIHIWCSNHCFLILLGDVVTLIVKLDCL